MAAKLGSFQYDDHKFERSLGQREEREVMILENGAKYEG